MKRHRYLPALPAAALVVAAAAGCGGTGASRHGGTNDRPAPVSPSVSAAPSSPLAPSERPSAQDRTWLVFAHQVNLAEVSAGGLAHSKGHTAAVRSAGQMLVTDHERLDAQLIKVADRSGVKLPKTPTPDDEALARKLQNEWGTRFDEDFLSAMVEGHQKAIADTKAEIAKGSSTAVQNLARTALPVLMKHLSVVQKAQRSG